MLCAAIGLGVAVALRPSADGAFRVISAGRVVERVTPDPVGDIGDRIFASVTALRDAGVALPPVEVGVSATLPESVGLASSAAITCAVITALLRLASASMPMREVIATALRAEREIVGVPCGTLRSDVDHRGARRRGAPARLRNRHVGATGVAMGRRGAVHMRHGRVTRRRRLAVSNAAG